MKLIIQIATGTVLGVLVLGMIVRNLAHDSYVMKTDYCPTVEQGIDGKDITLLKC